MDTREDILLVEDDRISAVATSRLLSLAGYRVDTARTGAQALERLGTRDYAAVFLDLHLPDMTGGEVARTIRDRSSAVRSHEILIVGLTAFISSEDRAAARTAGIDRLTEKPLDAERLHGLLARPDAPCRSPGVDLAFDRVELETRLGSPKLAATVIDRFLAVIDERVAEIRTAVEARELARIRTAAHALSSPAANVSASALRALLSRMEEAAVAGDMDTAMQCAADLEDEVARARAAIEAYLEHLRA